MQFGIHSAFHAGSVDLAEFANRCEQLGFESLWLPEHVVIPVNPTVGPGGVAGAPIPDSYVFMTDPLIGLTIAAAATKTLRLGTGVLLIPEHHPVDLAKHISSLDLYSNGRFILGVGAGWQPEESAALGGDFPRRWAQTTESIAIMKKLWTEHEPEHDGHYYSFPPLRFHPQPVQKPTPPILLGGGSKRLFDRIASWADGWAPWGPSPDDVSTGRSALDAACERAGRDPKTASVTAFTGTRDVDAFKAYSAAGADRLVITMDSTPGRNAFGRLEQIAKLAGL
ncbi:MAG: LLM class F420-dependent oxidoreductase [Chloroflexi bacterium]|nr:LLM class F420-dependent oxidoreductase [Chloroflexota bacterium]